MALIGAIRKNSWVLILLLGIAFVATIIMFMQPDGGGMGQMGQQLTLGEVDGQKLDRREFENAYGLLYSNAGGDAYSQRNQLWNYFLEEALVMEEAEKLGLGVSKTELLDLQFGPNPSRVIVQRFPNPNAPGTVNREQLNSIKQLIEENRVQQAITEGQLNPSFISYWRYQEKEIIKDRLQTKLNNLVTKAMYTPTWMAEMGFAEQNQPIDFAYVRVPFDEIDNTEITLTDADYEAYLKENAARYRQTEETRKIAYVSFDVVATAQDSAMWKNEIAELIPNFQNAENDSSFVLNNEGTINAFYFSKEELSEVIADTVMQIPVGSVYGPYLDGNMYKAVKVLDRQMMADSADSRHILISATTPDGFQQAKNTLDSLKNLLETGAASFDSLALRFSEDPGSSTKGGVYENVTPNQFVPEYNEVLFVTGEIGKLYPVRTSYGWHLVEVLKRSNSRSERVQLAYLDEAIEPTKETQDNVFEEASSLIANADNDIEKFEQLAAEKGLTVQNSQGLRANDFVIGDLGSGEDSRETVRWAFTAEPGDVSPSVYRYRAPDGYYDNKYVVAALRSVQKPGLPSVASIKDELEQAVINKKKAAMIEEKIQGMDLQAIASTYGTTVDTAANVNFSQTFITDLGNEPAVVATAFNQEVDQQSEAVVGNSGVFVIKTIKKPTLAAPSNLPQIRQRMSAAARSPVAGGLIQAMKKNAEVEDYRSRYY